MSKNGEQRRNDDEYDINRKKCNRSRTGRSSTPLYFSQTYYFFTFLNDYLTNSISLPLKTIKKFDIIYIQGKERCLRRASQPKTYLKTDLRKGDYNYGDV